MLKTLRPKLDMDKIEIIILEKEISIWPNSFGNGYYTGHAKLNYTYKYTSPTDLRNIIKISNLNIIITGTEETPTKEWTKKALKKFYPKLVTDKIKIDIDPIRKIISIWPNRFENGYYTGSVTFTYRLIQQLNKDVLFQQECAICLEELSNNCVQLTCLHSFHIECMRDMLLNGTRPMTCPICRAEFGAKDIMMVRIK